MPVCRVRKVAVPIISKSPHGKNCVIINFAGVVRRAILEHSINESCRLDAMILVNKIKLCYRNHFLTSVEQSKVPFVAHAISLTHHHQLLLTWKLVSVRKSAF